MKEFEKFYEGEKGNSQSDLNILSMTAHTFPKDYAKIFWQTAFELMSEWLEIEEPFEIFQARIKKELEG